MTERKNIDRLFQEKFKDFEAIPQEKIWDNIEAELKKKKKRRVIPFWLRLSGVAAALLIGILLVGKFVLNGEKPNDNLVEGNKTEIQKPAIKNGERPDKAVVEGERNNTSVQQKFPDPKNHTESAITETEQKDKPQTGQPDKKIKPNSSVVVSDDKQSAVKKGANEKRNHTGLGTQINHGFKTNKNAVANRSGSRKTHVNKNTNREKSKILNPNDNSGVVLNGILDSKTESGSNTTGSDNKKTLKNPEYIPLEDNIKNTNSIAENATDKKDTVATAAVPNSMEELLKEKENKVTAKEPKLNRWQISSNIAPIYFRSASNGSPLDSRFESNSKSFNTNLSYGAGVKYALTKKLSIKSGVNSVALEYNTNDLVFFQTANARKIENVKSNIQGSLIEVDNKPLGSAPANLGRTIKQYSGNLNQKTGYIEIPVEMSYKIVDRKFGVELIGGLSTLFLNQNEITIMSSGLEMNIGEANNLSSVHFSTNVGMGFRYSFLKSFQANLEPMFKYQINTFSNDSGNFKPYFFGLYTGLSYSF